MTQLTNALNLVNHYQKSGTVYLDPYVMIQFINGTIRVYNNPRLTIDTDDYDISSDNETFTSIYDAGAHIAKLVDSDSKIDEIASTIECYVYKNEALKKLQYYTPYLKNYKSDNIQIHEFYDHEFESKRYLIIPKWTPEIYIELEEDMFHPDFYHITLRKIDLKQSHAEMTPDEWERLFIELDKLVQEHATSKKEKKEIVDFVIRAGEIRLHDIDEETFSEWVKIDLEVDDSKIYPEMFSMKEEVLYGFTAIPHNF